MDRNLASTASLERWATGEWDALVRLCAELVAARSVNPPGDTRAAATVVAEEFRRRGVESRVEAADPAMPSVVASIDSGRPGPHLVLVGHLDTMPPGDERLWSVPPWELTRRDGRLYGLGMGNMKGAVAAMTLATSWLAAHRSEWSGRLSFLAVSDEVVFGSNGAAHLLATHPGLAGDALICGEGAGFGRLSVGEKGLLWLRIDAVGELGHSSKAREGEGAIARLARAIMEVDRLNGWAPALPADLAGIPVAADDFGLRLTANTGTIEGGTFIGQCATEASAQFDFRLPPGLSVDEVENRVRVACAGIPGLTISRLKSWEANWTGLGTDLVRVWQEAHRAISGSAAPLAIRQPASDASRWRLRGVPAICFGPQPTHSADIDDYAEEEEVLRCAVLYIETARRFLPLDRGEGRFLSYNVSSGSS